VVRRKDDQVGQVLHELEADKTPRLHVLNKIDLLPAEARNKRHNLADEMYVSARTGEGLEALTARIDQLVEVDPVSRVLLRIPQNEGKVLALVEARARILRRDYHDAIAEFEVEVPESVLREVREFVREGKRGAPKG